MTRDSIDIAPVSLDTLELDRLIAESSVPVPVVELPELDEVYEIISAVSAEIEENKRANIRFTSLEPNRQKVQVVAPPTNLHEEGKHEKFVSMPGVAQEPKGQGKQAKSVAQSLENRAVHASASLGMQSTDYSYVFGPSAVRMAAYRAEQMKTEVEGFRDEGVLNRSTQLEKLNSLQHAVDPGVSRDSGRKAKQFKRTGKEFENGHGNQDSNGGSGKDFTRLHSIADSSRRREMKKCRQESRRSTKRQERSSQPTGPYMLSSASTVGKREYARLNVPNATVRNARQAALAMNAVFQKREQAVVQGKAPVVQKRQQPVAETPALRLEGKKTPNMRPSIFADLPPSASIVSPSRPPQLPRHGTVNNNRNAPPQVVLPGEEFLDFAFRQLDGKANGVSVPAWDDKADAEARAEVEADMFFDSILADTDPTEPEALAVGTPQALGGPSIGRMESVSLDGPQSDEGSKRKAMNQTGPKLRFSKGAEPSKYCHVCGRSANTVNVAQCSNLRIGMCRKVLCEKCLILHEPENANWAKQPNTSWTCTHCRNKCPGRARCHQYTRNNMRRRIKNEQKRKAMEARGSDGHESRGPATKRQRTEHPGVGYSGISPTGVSEGMFNIESPEKFGV